MSTEVLNDLKSKHLTGEFNEACLNFLEMREKLLLAFKGVPRKQNGWKSLWRWVRLLLDVLEAAILALIEIGFFSSREGREYGEVPEVAAEYADYGSCMEIKSLTLQIVEAKIGVALQQPYWWLKGATKPHKLLGLGRRFALG
jgi:hypothetical protein